MKYTGAHISEVAGIQLRDIDLEANTLHIRANDLRPLKNNYRDRVMQISPSPSATSA